MRLGKTAATCATLLLFFGCATIIPGNKPAVESVHPRITAIDFQGVRLAVDVVVFNPYPFHIHATPARYTVDVKKKSLLSGTSTSEFTLLSRRRGKVTFPLTIAYSDLDSLGKDLAGKPELDYRAYGVVELSVLGEPIELPFSQKGALPILRPPAIEAVRVQLDDVSLSKARVIADAEITNPNVFDLGIEDLTFALNLGNASVAGLKASTGDTVEAGKIGKLKVAGEISASGGLYNVLMNGIACQPELTASGYVRTPYGKVRL